MSPRARLLSAAMLMATFAWTLLPRTPAQARADVEVEGWLRESRDLFAAEQWDAALGPTKALVERFPTQQVYTDRLARILSRLDRPVEEAAAWEQFVTSAATPEDACPALPRAYERAGDQARALDAYERCRDFDTSGAEGWFFLGQAYRRAGRLTDALQTFRDAVRVDPQHADSRVGLAGVLLARSEPAAALEAIEPAVAYDPGNVDVHLMQGLALMRLGRHDAARAALERAETLSDTYADVHLALGILDYRDGRTAAAHRRFGRAVALGPGRTDLQVWLDRTEVAAR